MVKKINTYKITNIISGAYDPLTTDGKILVNGIQASCYAEFHHDLAHIVMTPMQRFPESFNGYLEKTPEFLFLSPQQKFWGFCFGHRMPFEID